MLYSFEITSVILDIWTPGVQWGTFVTYLKLMMLRKDIKTYLNQNAFNKKFAMLRERYNTFYRSKLIFNYIPNRTNNKA